jgi:uncharacterized membrane protein
LVGLCLLAFGLRVARLDFHPIWFDEDLAYQRATATLTVSLASMAGSPLYYILLRGWVELAGASLFAMRYFSALWGMLTIPLIYQTTRRLLGSRVALATAVITIFAPFYIYYSQEARTYSLTLALMLLSMYAFLRWLDTRKAWALAVCCLVNLICLYTHFVAALVIAAQGVMLLLLRPVRWRDVVIFAATHAGVGLAFAPWLWRVWRVLPRVVAPPDSTTLDAWSILARTWTEFSVGRTLAPPLSLYLAMAPLFLALAGLLSVIGDQLLMIRGRRSEVRGQKSEVRSRKSEARNQRAEIVDRSCVIVLLVWLIVPIVGSLLVPRASVRFSPKYLIAVTPVYYASIVLGLRALRQESRALFWVCVIALAGISAFSLGDYYLRQHEKLAQAQHSFVKAANNLETRISICSMTSLSGSTLDIWVLCQCTTKRRLPDAPESHTMKATYRRRWHDGSDQSQSAHWPQSPVDLVRAVAAAVGGSGGGYPALPARGG